MGRRALKSQPGPTLWEGTGVPPVAVQAQRALQEAEEQRCLAREQASGKPARRRNIRVPTVRLGPQALAHRHDLLILVRDYDYDLSDVAFCEYCRQRGTLSVAGVPKSRRWKIFADHQRTKEQYLADPYFHFAQTHEGGRHKYTDDEMASGWRVICYGRAVLQDCWELYQGGATRPRSPLVLG